MNKTVTALTLAGIFQIASLFGTQFDRVQICFAPSEMSIEAYEGDIDLVVLKRFYEITNYVEGNNNEFKSDWIPIIKKSRLVKDVPANNPYIPLWAGGTLFSLLYAVKIQDNKVSRLQYKFSADLEAFKSRIYQNWVQGLNHRKVINKTEEFKAEKSIAQEISRLRSQGELLHLQKVLTRQEELEDNAHQARLSEFEKVIETNRNEASKQRHERLKRSDSAGTAQSQTSSKEELIQRLKEHENGWLYEICTGIKPLYIIGDQGSFKSYTAAAVALTRQYLEGCKLEAIVDPHFHQNKTKAWKTLLNLQPKTYGANQNWDEINQGIQDALSRWNVRTLDDKPICSIFDEMTNYSLHDECKELSAELNRRILSDPRKSNEGVIIISHGFTNAATGGTSGFAKTRESGTLQLELRSDNKMRPLFKGMLNGYKDSDGSLIKDMPIALPDWFKPETIYNWLWNNKTPLGKSTSEETEESSQKPTNTGDWHQEMNRWVKQEGRPTSVAVKQKWESLTGLTLNDQGLTDLMKYLNL